MQQEIFLKPLVMDFLNLWKILGTGFQILFDSLVPRDRCTIEIGIFRRCSTIFFCRFFSFVVFFW